MRHGAACRLLSTAGTGPDRQRPAAKYRPIAGDKGADKRIPNRSARNGWTGGSLEKYAPGKSIGGDRFGNYEGRLPEAPDRIYTECDIDTLGKSSRGAKRIVFSNDGLIFYTDDHYTSFTLLYGEE